MNLYENDRILKWKGSWRVGKNQDWDWKKEEEEEAQNVALRGKIGKRMLLIRIAERN